MIIFNDFKLKFLNNDSLEKLSNILKFCNNIILNSKIYKSNINYFYLYKFKFNLFNYLNLIKIFDEVEDNLYLINKLFEGNSTFIENDLNFFNIGVLNKININYVYNVNVFSINKLNCKYKYKTNFFNLSLILFPLTFYCYSNINMYIYNIYSYLYDKTFNPYKSCILSLFYYYNGLLYSLIYSYIKNNINILQSNILVIVSKLSSFVTVINSSYCNNFISCVYKIKLINIINNSLYLCNIKTCEYKPYLIGLTKYSLINFGILSKLSFQDTLRTLKNIVFENKIDWKVDSKSNIILSNFIPAGSGWYRYFIN